MGQVLPAPISSKNLERWGNQTMRIGSSEMQGYRLSMEDTHTVRQVLSKKHPRKSFFAVFDGHGGSKASIFMKERLADEVGKLDNPLDKGALTKCLQELDVEFMKQGKDDRENGSTSVFAILDQKEDSWKGTVGNLGDSRAIIVRADGHCDSLTKDHKPSDHDEEERIQKAGGFVRANRVDGQLAMSRAIGDWKYKENSNLAPDKQKVIAVPEFQDFEIRKGDSLLLYCDGIVEQMTNEEVAAFVVKEIKEIEKKKESFDPAMLMTRLLDFSLDKGSKDNMSGLLIMFMDGSGYETKKSEFIAGPFNPYKGDESFRSAYLADAKKYGYEGDELMEMARKSELNMPKKAPGSKPAEAPTLAFQNLIQSLTSGLSGAGEEKAKQLLGALLSRPMSMAANEDVDGDLPMPPEPEESTSSVTELSATETSPATGSTTDMESATDTSFATGADNGSKPTPGEGESDVPSSPKKKNKKKKCKQKKS